MTGDDGLDLAAVEAALLRFERECAAPDPKTTAWLRAWAGELDRLQAFAAGLAQGRGRPAGAAETGLSAAGLLLGLADLGTLLSGFGLAAGWYGLFFGLGGWIRAEREAVAAVELQRRIRLALLRLDALC